MKLQQQTGHMKACDMLCLCQNEVLSDGNVDHAPHGTQHSGHIVKIQSETFNSNIHMIIFIKVLLCLLVKHIHIILTNLLLYNLHLEFQM